MDKQTENNAEVAQQHNEHSDHHEDKKRRQMPTWYSISFFPSNYCNSTNILREEAWIWVWTIT